MTNVLLKKLSGFFDIDDGIRGLIADLCKERCEFAAGTLLVPQGGDYTDVLLLEHGWVTRARHLENGSRQIVNFVIPGDFVAMNALLFRTSDFELKCKTAIQAYRIPISLLGETLKRNATLSSALFWVNAHEESLLAERIVSLGRRSARERTAHVLCEVMSRLEIAGVEDIGQFIVPLSQEDFADTLGISVVHMNKTLRALEREQILSFRKGVLRVLNRKKLEIEAGFDDGYIQFTRRNDRNAWKARAI